MDNQTINNNCKIPINQFKNNNNNINIKKKDEIIGRINVNALMDDITIYTQINSNAYTINIIPRCTQIKMARLFQNCINIIYYLKINNIPTNPGKTQIMTINEKNFKNITITEEKKNEFEIRYKKYIQTLNNNN